MINYSQNQEQQHIINYFGNFKGTFLSVGENDGVTLSNVRALAELGWCGVMIEPAPLAYAKLKQLYSKEKKGCFYTYNCAIGDHNGKGTLFDSGTLLKTGDTSLVSTLVAEEKKRFESVLSYTPVEVDVYRWKTFLNRLKIKEFDFVSIDTEGVELSILQQMDLPMTNTRLVCVEWNGHEVLKHKFSELLGSYKIIYTSVENLLFARPE